MDVSIQMKEILDEYTLEVRRATSNSMDVVAKEAVRKLKNTSPRQAKHRRKYAEGWALRRVKTGIGIPEMTVYNKTNYQLTHLLENGHIIDNGKGTYGRTRPIKHIAPVNDWACDELPKEIKKELEK